MAQIPRVPGTSPLSIPTFATGRTIRGTHGQALATSVNHAAYGHMGGRLVFHPSASGSSAEAWEGIFRPNDHCRFAQVRALLTATAGATSAAVTLQLDISDGAGHSITSADTRIPPSFAPKTHPVRTGYVGSMFGSQVEAWLDLDALRTTLDASAPWRLKFTLTGTYARTDLVQVDEMPRGIVDDSWSHGGVLPQAMQWGVPITDAAQWDRIALTDRTAFNTRRTYLTRVYSQTVTTNTPHTAGTSLAAFTNLEESAGVPISYAFLPRRLLAVADPGAKAEWAVIYKLTGGAGTETATVRLTTASGHTKDLTGLAHTGSSWAFSSVTTLDLSTNGSGGVESVSATGKVSAGGPTLYLAALSLWEKPE